MMKKLFTFAEIARRFKLNANTIKYHIKENVTIGHQDHSTIIMVIIGLRYTKTE